MSRGHITHPAPALGDDAQAHKRLRVADARGRQPPGDVLRHPAPRQVVRLTAALKSAPPQPRNLSAEDANARAITGNAVITDMPGNDRTQIGTLFRERQVHALPGVRFSPLPTSRPTGLESFAAAPCTLPAGSSHTSS